jgi:hypothetical protein
MALGAKLDCEVCIKVRKPKKALAEVSNKGEIEKGALKTFLQATNFEEKLS